MKMRGVTVWVEEGVSEIVGREGFEGGDTYIRDVGARICHRGR